MTLPQVVLTDTDTAPQAASCPDVTIDGFRIPGLRRVVVDAPFNDVAEVTITLIAKVRHV